MPAKVNPDPPLTPGTLRAFFARHVIIAGEVAERLGVTRSAVSKAVHADLTGRPVSQTLLHRIADAAAAALLRREEPRDL